MENVIWKPIEGFEGLYEAGSNGEIKALEKHRPTGKQKHVLRIYPEKIMKPSSASKRGYKITTLMKNGKQHYFSVHRLIAKTHIPNPENLPCVLHKDNDKLNCAASNLKWGTLSENSKQAFEDGLQPGAWTIEKNPSARKAKNILTNETYNSLKQAHEKTQYPKPYYTFLKRISSINNDTNCIKI